MRPVISAHLTNFISIIILLSLFPYYTTVHNIHVKILLCMSYCENSSFYCFDICVFQINRIICPQLIANHEGTIDRFIQKRVNTHIV